MDTHEDINDNEDYDIDDGAHDVHDVHDGG